MTQVRNIQRGDKFNDYFLNNFFLNKIFSVVLFKANNLFQAPGRASGGCDLYKLGFFFFIRSSKSLK